MYSDTTLTNHLQTSNAISTKSKVVAEWNLNNSETILAIGNYKNRPSGSNSTPSYTAPNTAWNPNENKASEATNEWFGYTEYDTVIDAGYTDQSSTPVTFLSTNERQKSLMSLEDCFNRFRPRSGINKARLFSGTKSLVPFGVSLGTMFNKPRYYFAGKDDNFKYWSSYRKQNNTEYGMSGAVNGLPNVIHDAAPFVIYKNLIPTNKVVLKIQTNVSSYNASAIANNDPFYSGSNPNYKSTPLMWKIQKYTGSSWEDLYSTTSDEFTGNAAESGYFQLSYGLTNTEVLVTYKNNFVIIGTLSSTAALPLIQDPTKRGETYLVKSSDTDKGTLYIYNGGVADIILDNYTSVVPTYGWYKSEESITNSQMFITELDKSLAPSFVESSITKYREFEYIQGLRIVVNTMANTNCTFDLIELSPRLEVDLTDMTTSFSVKKFASDIGVSNLPVSQLLASTGEISIFDFNECFNINNQDSLLNVYALNNSNEQELQFTFSNKSIQLRFYEIVSRVPQEFAVLSKTPVSGTTNITITTESAHNIDVGDTVIVSGVEPIQYNGIWTTQAGTTGTTLVLNIGSNPGNITKSGTAISYNSEYKDFYIPIKTLYSDGFPQYSDATRDVSISLRDFSFYFESFVAPELLLKDASLSFIIATLLDSVGFVNYKFLRSAASSEMILPYFMVPPNKSLMEVLEQLAIATQTTMFFDEVNNFVIMDKDYLLPESESVRAKNITLYGYDKEARKANIADIASESNDIYNDGKIVYYDRYIKKQTNELRNLSLLDKNQTFRYERNILWALEAIEKAGQSRNEEDITSSAYPLTAIPLAKPLSKDVPTVATVGAGPFGVLKNNIIDFGDAVYWLGRYNGYFYSNGEIIKYDAKEYTYTSDELGAETTVWVTSQEEYQYYFSQVPFNGKMYPTGKVRIYAEPEYEEDGITLKIGDVLKHGRGQFGTTVAEHLVPNSADANWWDSPQAIATQYHNLFGSANTLSEITANKNAIVSRKMSAPTTQIKNFLSNKTYSTKLKQDQIIESIQASALSLAGPSFSSEVSKMSCINYVKKKITDDIKDTKFDTFGARLRILGDVSKIAGRQELFNSYPAYSNLKDLEFTTNKDELVIGPTNIGAKSGGISILTNADGEGYYYEVLALDYVNTPVLDNQVNTNTLFFYKLTKNNDGVLIPSILYEGFQNILVDTGKFTSKVLGSNRGEDSVYDIAVTVKRNSVVVNNTTKYSYDFAIYFDNKIIKTVNDSSPITNGVTENISLFVRGSSDLLFENVFAMRRFLDENESGDTLNVFNDATSFGISAKKYELSPLVKTGFLSKQSESTIPETKIWYEEFGAIMRECAYFNVKFDKAYPALRSVITEVPAYLGGYLVAGYTSTPYRAEFLIFNTTDFAIDLGSNRSYTDNVSITGVTFTQEAAKDLTVDEFLTNTSNFTNNPDFDIKENKKQHINIKNNRLLYGSKSFVLDSPYIQSTDMAQNLMKFLINRLTKPRKAVGVEIFGMPILQLGDIVNFSYDPTKNLPHTITNNNFVIYAIDYSKSADGQSTKIYLSEVV